MYLLRNSFAVEAGPDYIASVQLRGQFRDLALDAVKHYIQTRPDQTRLRGQSGSARNVFMNQPT